MIDGSFEQGLDLRRRMFGPGGAERQIEAATPFTLPMQEWVTSNCFGDVWQRPGLDHRTRSLLTLAMLVAMGRGAEIKVHTKGAIANGATVEEIRELMLHAMVYCGVPLGVEGFRSAAEVLKELGLD